MNFPRRRFLQFLGAVPLLKALPAVARIEEALRAKTVRMAQTGYGNNCVFTMLAAGVIHAGDFLVVSDDGKVRAARNHPGEPWMGVALEGVE